MVLTTEDAKWIKDYYYKEVHGRTLRGDIMNGYYEAERILNGWDEIQRRGCSCQWRNVAMGVHALLGRYKEEIDKLYEQATTPKRGRKKRSVGESES